MNDWDFNFLLMPINTQEIELQIQDAESAETKVDALNALSTALRESNPSRALEIAQEAYNLASTPTRNYIHYLKGMAESLDNLSQCHYLKGNYPQALTDSRSALGVFKAIKDRGGKAKTLVSLGIVYLQLDDYGSALKHLMEGLTLYETLQDRPGQAFALSRIGFVHSKSGDYGEALKFYQKSLLIFREIGDLSGEARLLSRCSVDYTQMGQFQLALDHGQQSVEVFQRIGDHYREGFALSELGRAYALSGQADVALQTYQRALELLEPRSAPHAVEYGRTLLAIGQLHLQSGQTELAQPLLQRALDLAAEAGIKKNEYEACQILSLLHEKQGDLKTALDYYKRFVRLKDQVFNEDSDRTVKNLNILYQTRQAEGEAEQQRKLREEDRRYFENLNQMKNEFISAASHDLKNPLAVIMSATYLVRRYGRVDDEKGSKYLDRIDNAAMLMRDLVNDVFELAKLETGRALNMSQIILHQFVQDTISHFQDPAQKKNIQLTTHLNFSDLVITADAVQIRRSLDNLLSNAIKYTPEGGQVDLWVEQSDARIIFRVVDSGLGIPDEDIPKLFQRFYRVQHQSHLMIEGSGLGLAIVRSIIEQHGGKIWVESQLGKGSTFAFSLPLQPKQAV